MKLLIGIGIGFLVIIAAMFIAACCFDDDESDWEDLWDDDVHPDDDDVHPDDDGVRL